MIVVQIIVFLLGFGIALSTLFSAIKQTVLPGRKKVRLSRAVARTTFRLFRLGSFAYLLSRHVTLSQLSMRPCR